MFFVLFVFDYDGLFISLPPPIYCYIFKEKQNKTKTCPSSLVPCDYYQAFPRVDIILSHGGSFGSLHRGKLIGPSGAMNA